MEHVPLGLQSSYVVAWVMRCQAVTSHLCRLNIADYALDLIEHLPAEALPLGNCLKSISCLDLVLTSTQSLSVSSIHDTMAGHSC